MSLDWSKAAQLADSIAAGWAGAPGGACVLFAADGVRHAAAGGLASLEYGVTFTADTPSRYASISKHVLAIALMLAGFDLSAPLGTLLPALPPALGAVPLWRGLAMTGGLPDLMELLWQQGASFTATVSAADAMAAIRRIDTLSSPPGSEMAYSNTGWRLGQAALEARLGRPYAELLQELLFAPLGAALVFPADETEIVPGLATGYWHDGAAWRRGRYGMHVSASGGLAGSAAALAHWSGALMQGRGPLAGMLDRLLAPCTFNDGSPSAYRLGLVETRLGETRIVAHSGALPGYRNHLLLAPDLGIGVALLLNRDEDPLPPALRVLAALLGRALPPAPTLPAGLFVAESGPVWAELHADAIEFMGGRETLIAEGDGYRSFPSTLDLSMRLDGDRIEGRFGGVTRRLQRVGAAQALDPRLVGEWRDPVFGAALTIRADGSARWPFAGGIGQEIALTALPGGRALARVGHLMWTHRPCLWLDGDTLRVASHRSRVLAYRRA